MIDENKDYDCEVFNDDPKYNKMQEDHDIIIWKKLFWQSVYILCHVSLLQ